ncbi:hypothetical protein CYMTET_22079 [Cymbomonas tetramitiformis]|uniref:Uncharacterized protein n=1 Tax=Cymbomonas tetramitiformis TaxID=36881 RepID=A0AAE0G0U7_9CHLO|nr:hypothetical protein CYMTET_22079 [Cymbomonas tetramitiformis]
MNTTFSAPIQMTPYKCLFGYAPRLEEKDASLCLEAAEAYFKEGVETPVQDAAVQDGAGQTAEEPVEGSGATVALSLTDEEKKAAGGEGSTEDCLRALGALASDTKLQFSEADVNVSICLWENEDGDNLYYPCTVVGFAEGKHTIQYWKDSQRWSGNMQEEAYTVFHRVQAITQQAGTPQRHKRSRAAAQAANENSRQKIAKVCHQGAEKKDYKLGDLVGVHVPCLDANGLDEKFVLGVVCDVPHTNKYKVWTNAGVLNICYPAAKLELMTEAVRNQLSFKYEAGSEDWKKVKQVALGSSQIW